MPPAFDQSQSMEDESGAFDGYGGYEGAGGQFSYSAEDSGAKY